ncbi:hypothetical protein HA402_013218 [Bradysia odoriphaga]|nr:hypothetical protein HA402_013218 [Bradysia odoriphaga]
MDTMANEASKTSETPSNNKITLSSSVLEKLYQRYSIKQRRAGLECFLAASVLFDLWAIFIPQGQLPESIGITCVFLLLNVLLIIILKIFKRSKHRGILYDVTPMVAWIIAILQLLLQLLMKITITPRDSLGWAILLNFLVHVSLPIPLKYTGILFGFGSYTLHLSITMVLPKKEEYFVQQVQLKCQIYNLIGALDFKLLLLFQQLVNSLLMITAASIGLLCYFMGESKHRRAFLEAKQSLEVKMVIEEQSAEQERLLLSVLPEHVAVKMRQDLGSDDSEQFKKIYMSRHENVRRVHISEKTLSFLSGEFEVEPALGEKREEALRIAGLKTYFIKKVLKPFVSTNPEHTNGSAKIDTDGSIESDCASISSKDGDEKVHMTGDYDTAESLPDKDDDFKQRLKKELLSRDHHGELSKDTTIFLTFKSKELERSYSAHKEPLSTIPLVASPLVLLVGTIYSSVILPSSWLHFIISLSPIFLVLLFVTATVGETLKEILPNNIYMASKKFNNVVCLRRFAAIVIIFSVAFSNILDMVSEINIFFEISFKTNMTAFIRTMPHAGGNYTLNITAETETFPATVCLVFPSYFSNYAVLILIATSLVAQLSHICKICIMIIITVLHCGVNIFFLDEHFCAEEQHTGNAPPPPIYFSLSALLIAVTIALGFLTRHMDKEDRVIFKWRNEVNEQREKASDMRRRNEALVYNILPVHVAEHFMRNKQRSYDQLYSQSYDEVGVLFASMPNFSDFYSEDTVNNQGLECLRFLNEVISDFDALLELPKYQDVNKIKTIGSTYMAASGLNPVRRVKPEDPIVIRWEHLSILVEFALELKKALQCINEQSFNHFVLKMGINHGPITAGVIGARKPQYVKCRVNLITKPMKFDFYSYDIWGNTVNVASRMESTGKAGAIQVTEETCEILQTFGYTFEQRGLVAVKGKGQLMTYYLQGKTVRQNSIHSSPILASINPMETLPEMDESKESTPPNEQSGSLLPSISSSSNSPNSVKVNQTYLKSQLNQTAQNETLAIELNATMNDTKVANNVDNLSLECNDNINLVNCSSDGSNSALLDVDTEASTPLLDAKNSTNSNAINSGYSDSEKEALIFNSNSSA